jgi:hypothetical protein
MMSWKLAVPLCAALLAAGCDRPKQQPVNQIKVRSAEQNQLHALDALNLAIALKRAIYDAGYTCKRVTDAGFVAEWKNLDMWTAHCEYDRGPAVDWAIFAGPDGGAQVRDCKDIPGTGLPTCKIAKRPRGDFNDVPK